MSRDESDRALAQALYISEESDQVRAAFATALEADPTHAFAFYEYGLFLQQQGEIEAARAAFGRAVALDPENDAWAEALSRLPSSAQDGLQPSRISINSASIAELAGLPGCGPVLAQRIVAHRQRHGPFHSLDALRDVAGIGLAKLAGMRPCLTL